MQSLNGKSTGSSLTAAEWNQLPTEVQNVITQSGQTLSAGDLTQLAKAIATYVAAGTFYTDSGAANAYVLSNVGSLIAPDAYHTGMEIRFIPSNNNTGASTVNVSGLGVVNILDLDGNPMASGQLVTSQVYTLFYSTAFGGDFLLIPVSSGFDITGLTQALLSPDDTVPFFDDSAAGNRKTPVFSLGNRTWNSESLPTGVTTISADEDYEKAYIRTSNSGTGSVVVINASTTPELIGTSFILTNSGDSGADISVSRETVDIILIEGVEDNKPDATVHPGQIKLFYRNANNSYIIFSMNHLLYTQSNFWTPGLPNIGGSSSFDNSGANNWQDYRRHWQLASGSGTLTYTATGSEPALMGTSFLVSNHSAGGNLTFDVSAMSTLFGPSDIDLDNIENGEAYLFYRTTFTDVYHVFPVARKPPEYPKLFYKSSTDSYTNDTTLSVDSELNDMDLGVGLWHIEAVIGVVGRDDTNYKFAINTSGGSIGDRNLALQCFSETNTIGDIDQAVFNASGNIVTLGSAGLGTHQLNIQGYLTVTSPTTLSYLASQAISTGTTTSTLVDSYIKFTPMFNSRAPS